MATNRDPEDASRGMTSATKQRNAIKNASTSRPTLELRTEWHSSPTMAVPFQRHDRPPCSLLMLAESWEANASGIYRRMSDVAVRRTPSSRQEVIDPQNAIACEETHPERRVSSNGKMAFDRVCAECVLREIPNPHHSKTSLRPRRSLSSHIELRKPFRRTRSASVRPTF